MKAPLEGEVLADKYHVERTLGKGGMGVVVAATHVHLRQPVAIKFLLEEADKETVARFSREARAAVRLKSDHVARVLDVGALPDGAPYMVMEYLNGQDLSQVVRQQGPLSVAEAVLYLLHTCEAIAEAHSMGIIHRDLKPANLFLTRGADGANTIKVLDFGISKVQDDQAEGDGVQLTQTSVFLGSPLYMSPEQLKSARDVTVRSDIWSLGAILYQLLAGRAPFDAKSLSELILMVNIHPPTPLSTFRNDVPPGIEAAILRCLEKSPDLRFQSVGELAWAIFEHGPPEARASAEKIVRTLETVGVQVQRTSDTSGVFRAPSIPPSVAQQGMMTAATVPAMPALISIAPPASVAPPGSTTVPGSSMAARAPSAGSRGARVSRKGPLLIAGAVIGVAILGIALSLTLRSPPPSPAQVAAPAVSAEVSPPSVVPAAVTTMPVPEPPAVVAPTASPELGAASATAPGTNAKKPPRPGQQAAPPVKSVTPAAPETAAPKEPTLKMKIKQ